MHKRIVNHPQPYRVSRTLRLTVVVWGRAELKRMSSFFIVVAVFVAGLSAAEDAMVINSDGSLDVFANVDLHQDLQVKNRVLVNAFLGPVTKEGAFHSRLGQNDGVTPLTHIKLQNVYLGTEESVGMYRNWVAIDAWSGDQGAANGRMASLAMGTAAGWEGTFDFLRYEHSQGGGEPVMRINARIGPAGTEVHGFLKSLGSLTVGGADLVLGTASGRDVGNKINQRALVHGENDTLLINYNGDFEGGVFSESKFTAPEVATPYSVLTSDPNGALELGSDVASGVVPFIDFHYGVNAFQDFNARIQNDNNRVLSVHFAPAVTQGILQVHGDADVKGRVVTSSLRTMADPNLTPSVSASNYISSGNDADAVALEVRQGRYNKDVLVISSNQVMSGANLLRAHENGADKFVVATDGVDCSVPLCATSGIFTGDLNVDGAFKIDNLTMINSSATEIHVGDISAANGGRDLGLYAHDQRIATVSDAGIQIESGKELRVGTHIWADFVFAEDYELMPIEDVQEFINKNGHLPGVPSASVIKKTGLNMIGMMSTHMRKIEELTLYAIELSQLEKAQRAKIAALTSEVASQRALIEALSQRVGALILNRD